MEMELEKSTKTEPTDEDVIKNVTSDEDLKFCPACATEIRQLFLEYNQKVLICNNNKCGYPFTRGSVVGLLLDPTNRPYEIVHTLKPTESMCTSDSMISSSAWSDIMKMDSLNESEEQLDSKSDTKYYTPKINLPKIGVTEEVNPNSIKELKMMHMKDAQMSEEISYIRNEKWVRNLMALQNASGVTLLKDEEMKMFKKTKLCSVLGELKIDIGKGVETDMSTIKIEIANVKNN